MVNSGKKFEKEFKDSINPDYFIYRFRDSATSFYMQDSNIRFTPSNIADFLIYDKKNLYLLELKSHKGKSIPLNCIIGNKTKEKQIKDLLNASDLGVKCYLIIFFSDISECFALSIANFKEFLDDNEEKKSIPLNYLKEHSISIKTYVKRTSHSFDLSNLFI